MTEEIMLEYQVQKWEAEGRWVDRGRWVRRKGRREYVPTKREIADKCRLFRTIEGWHGANKRAPRGGEFGVETTAGV